MTTRRLFAAIFAIALFTTAVRETLDPDMWWHLRTGQHIVQNGLPRQDVFSYTVPTHEWITHEWLSQVIMWGVYQVAQLPGLILFFGVLVAMVFWLVYKSAAGQPFLAGFVVLLAAFASAIVWGARPQIFNLLFTAVFVFVLEQRKDRKISQRIFWILPLLTIIWANLHSGYLLGTVLLGTYLVGETIQRLLGQSDDRTLEWSDIRQLGYVTLAGFLAAVINPSGPELWLYPFLTLGSPAMQAFIQEWHSPDFHQAFFWPFAMMVALGVFSWLYNPKRPVVSELLLFFGTAAAGLLSARHIPLFAVVSAPIITRQILRSLKGTSAYPFLIGHNSSHTSSWLMKALNWLVLVMALLVSGLWITAKIDGNQAAIEARYPVAAVDFLEQEGMGDARGYNSYNWGGYLIWRGVPVFVDGRADVYGDEFLFYYRKSFDIRPDWQEPLKGFDVDYVLMERGSALSVLLLETGEWRQLYADDVAQIIERN